MAVNINHKPTFAPTSASISFKDHNKLTFKWKNPKQCKDQNRNDRYAWNTVSYRLNETRVTVGSDGTMKRGAKIQKTGWDGVLNNNFEVVETCSATINRSSYYPNGFNTVVDSITAEIAGKNSYGSISKTVELRLNPPRKPSISASFDTSNGKITFTIKTDAGTDTYERNDTYYYLERYDEDTVGAGYGSNGSHKVQNGFGSNSATSFTVTHDVAQHATLTGNQYVKVTCYAWARGMAGNSSVVSKSYLLAAPGVATITDITAAKEVNGRVTIFISPNASTNHPIDSLQLQRLTNTTIGTKAAAAAATGWEDVDGAVDDGYCKGFSDQKSDATPEVRKHTWYRVISTYGALSAEGMPYEAKVLYRDRDAASADAIKWPSIDTTYEGSGIEMRMGWATDSYNATEVTWSANVDAWESDKQPESFILEWEDASPQGYAHTARFVISELEAGVPVYIRARRVLVEDGKISQHGEWCSPAAAYYPLTPGESAREATLVGPPYVIWGSGADFQWSYTGTTMKRWELYRVDGYSNTCVASGSTASGKATVSWQNIYSMLGNANFKRFFLKVTSSSGETAQSNYVSVGVYKQPELTLTAPATLTAKPLTLSFETNINTCDVQIIVMAGRTISPSYADGGGEQLEGDTVWAGRVNPTWAASGNVFTASLDVDAVFHQDGLYRVTAVAIDRETGLTSEQQEAEVEVNWAHRADAPEATIAVDAENLSAAITPAATENAVETDVCDIYRISDGRVQLIASDVEFGESVVDRFAPFSNEGGLAYRLAARTVDGDTDWQDVGYQMNGESLVIDFGNDRITLPWGIAKSDSYTKPFTQTPRWDGSMPGQWDGGVSRTAELTTSLITPDGPEQAALLHRLAKYMGACFVRTPDGSAFAANVDVSSYGGSMRSKAKAVSLNVTEVDLTDEFRALEE